MKISFLLFLIVIFWGCKSEETPVLTNIDGTYKGKFYLAVPNTDFESSEITLTFKKGRFSGRSSKLKYPAICKGTYEIVGKEIKFINECFWTTEINFGLILSGNFNYSMKEGKLSNLTKKEGYNSNVYIISKSE